jgi:hypothetical protein
VCARARVRVRVRVRVYTSHTTPPTHTLPLPLSSPLPLPHPVPLHPPYLPHAHAHVLRRTHREIEAEIERHAHAQRNTLSTLPQQARRCSDAHLSFLAIHSLPRSVRETEPARLRSVSAHSELADLSIAALQLCTAVRRRSTARGVALQTNNRWAGAPRPPSAGKDERPDAVERVVPVVVQRPTNDRFAPGKQRTEIVPIKEPEPLKVRLTLSKLCPRARSCVHSCDGFTRSPPFHRGDRTGCEHPLA